MSKIPKEIVDKIEQRNKLNEEIETWGKEHLDMDGMDSDCADITDHHIGKEQGSRIWSRGDRGHSAVLQRPLYGNGEGNYSIHYKLRDSKAGGNQVRE